MFRVTLSYNLIFKRPGGQAVDTTNNCVQLQHKPTGATVKCHKTRYLEQNRKEARKLLVEKVDDVLNPECSLRLIRLEKAIQKNHVKQRRAAKKYQELNLAKAGNLDEKVDLSENTQDIVPFK